MDLEGIMLSEISQTKKYKYGMVSLTCGIQTIANLWKQRVDWWLPGAKDEGNW